MTSGLAWRKPSRSGGQGGNCVEVASGLTAVAVRDSKDPHSAVLAFTPRQWEAFTRSLRISA